MPAEGEEPVHHLFVTRADDPDALAARLADAGIAARSYYRVPGRIASPRWRRTRPARSCPGTERAAATNLALPMGPTLGEDVARAVVDALEGA